MPSTCGKRALDGFVYFDFDSLQLGPQQSSQVLVGLMQTAGTQSLVAD